MFMRLDVAARRVYINHSLMIAVCYARESVATCELRAFTTCKCDALVAVVFANTCTRAIVTLASGSQLRSKRTHLPISCNVGTAELIAMTPQAVCCDAVCNVLMVSA